MTNMSISGLYTLRPSIFSRLAIPEGVDKDILVSNILMNCNELEILYPDPDAMTAAVEIWSNARLSSWKRQADVLAMEYNPLWNKDGTYTETEDIEAESGNASKVAAFDSSDLETAAAAEGSSKSGRKLTRREQGNIGVTTSQQMLMEEIEVSRINIYDIIVHDFKKQFCLAIY